MPQVYSNPNPNPNFNPNPNLNPNPNPNSDHRLRSMHPHGGPVAGGTTVTIHAAAGTC